MADIWSKKKRSEVMSRIRGKNTSLELLVFRYLRGRRIHFQRHYTRTHGSPDLALPSRKIAVFLDGDFWHGWKWARRKEKMKKDYWIQKIEGNIRRDRRNRRSLRQDGWRVLRIWEHELRRKRDRHLALHKIACFLTQDRDHCKL